MGMGPLHVGQLPVFQRGCSSSSLALSLLSLPTWWVHWDAGCVRPLPSTGIICTFPAEGGSCETLEQAGIPPGFPKVPGPGWGAVWEGRANGDVWQMESAVIM